MTNSTLRNLGLGLMVSVASGGMALAKETSADSTIILRAYNNAAVPDKTLIQAQAEVTRIFARLRVKATWAVAPTIQSEGPYDFSLAVIILDRSAAALIPRSKMAMGHTPHAAGAADDDLRLVLVLDDNRRSPRGDLIPLDLPALFAGSFVERDRE